MKLYGYSKKVVNEHGLHDLSEVTFKFDSQTLRKIAEFLNKAADEIDKGLNGVDHEHVQDLVKGWPEDAPDIIVPR
jgi:hypothetical protein